MKRVARIAFGSIITGLGLYIVIASLLQILRDWHWLIIALIGFAVSVSGYSVIIGEKIIDVVRDFIDMILFAP